MTYEEWGDRVEELKKSAEAWKEAGLEMSHTSIRMYADWTRDREAIIQDSEFWRRRAEKDTMEATE